MSDLPSRYKVTDGNLYKALKMTNDTNNRNCQIFGTPCPFLRTKKKVKKS